MNTNKELVRHTSKSGLFLVLAITVIGSIFGAVVIAWSDCTNNWLDRSLHLSNHCSSTSLSYDGKNLHYIDRNGIAQTISLALIADQIKANSATTYELKGTELVATTNTQGGHSVSSSVDLSSLVNGDPQQLTLNGTVISISGGGSIDLASLIHGSQGAVGAQGPQGTSGVLSVSNGMLSLNGTDLSIMSCLTGEMLKYGTSAWTCDQNSTTNLLTISSTGSIQSIVNGVNSNVITVPVAGASNGLTLSGNSVTLGGTLSQDTQVLQNGYTYVQQYTAPSTNTEQTIINGDVGSYLGLPFSVYGTGFFGTRLG